MGFGAGFGRGGSVRHAGEAGVHAGLRLGAVVVLLSALTFAAAAAADAAVTYTWTGLGDTANWSDTGNWTGGHVPGDGGDLVFPDIPACDPVNATTCGTTDDLAGLTVDSVDISGDYTIDGTTVLGLGAGGLTADFSPSNGGGDGISAPLQLTANQTWTLSNASLGSTGTITGASGRTLTIDASDDADMSMAPSDPALPLDDEIGTIDLVGGSLDVGPAISINTANGKPINLSNGAQLIGTASIGPVTSTTDGFLAPGSGASGILSVTGGSGAVSLDSTSFVILAVGGSGSTPGADFDQLSATGPVDLGGAALDVSAGDPSGQSQTCPVLTQGTTYPLITGASITGLLSSDSFPGGDQTTIPDLGYVPIDATGGCAAAPSASLQIHYTPTAVEATVTPAITTTDLTSDETTTVDAPVTINAEVQPDPSTAVPSGTISFTNGNSPIAGCSNIPVATPDAGATYQASCSTSFAAAGQFSITASYSGTVSGTDPTLPSSATDTEYVTSSSAPAQTITGTDPSASAGATSASATGDGTITVTDYSGSDPAGSPAGFSASGEYFDVRVHPGGTFSVVAVTECALGGGSSLFWWNGASWNVVYPETYDAGTGCITATLGSGSSPTIAQLNGTPFAVGSPRPGYSLAASDGGIFAYGDAAFYGSHGGSPLNQPIVGITSTPDGKGYWLAASDGGIFAYGDAAFYGSHGGSPLNQPIVGITSTPDGKGYWLAASDGGIFAYGDAAFYGSHGGSPLNQPIVGITSTPDGKGYWLAASDGGIFAYGDAAFYGSHGGSPLNQPIVGITSTPDGKGYWLAASDGGIFAYGDAAFYGSHGGSPLNQPIVGITSTPDGKGYWLAASDGGIFAYGDAAFYGSHGGSPLNQPIVGLAGV